MSSGLHEPMRTRSSAVLVGLGLLIVILIAGFVALGVWQLERRAWKLDLMRQVDARVHATPVPAPGPDQWAAVIRERDQYRHVALTGIFLNDWETQTQAVTDFGPGFWVMTPFRSDQGFTVLINRGFVPSDRRAPDSRAAGQSSGHTTVYGLLRITEPGGGFLRSNAPATERWYSRDVAAIGARRGVSDLAPYFVDADGTANPAGWPVGGLTVLHFTNNHLVYALTWFSLAIIAALGGFWIVLDVRRAGDRTRGENEG